MFSVGFGYFTLKRGRRHAVKADDHMWNFSTMFSLLIMLKKTGVSNSSQCFQLALFFNLAAFKNYGTGSVLL